MTDPYRVVPVAGVKQDIATRRIADGLSGADVAAFGHGAGLVETRQRYPEFAKRTKIVRPREAGGSLGVAG